MNRQDLTDISVTYLPKDVARPPASAYVRAREEFPLGEELNRRLEEFQRRADNSALALLLSALAGLLFRYSGSPKILLSTVAIREGVVCPVVVPAKVARDCTGDNLLKQLLAAAPNSLPFQEFAEQLGASAADYLPTGLVLLEEPLTEQDLDDVGDWTVELDFLFILRRVAGQWLLSCDFNAELISAATCEVIAGHYLTVLEALSADRSAPLATLPLERDDQQKQLQRQRNNTDVSFPAPETLDRLIRPSIAATPQAVAVVDAGQQLTYAALDERTNQVAHYLRQHVDAGDVVAVYLDRSAEILTALLGIIKAGAAYLPLDPDYPVERIAYILDDADADIVLVDSRTTGHLPKTAVEKLLLDPRAWQHCPTTPVPGAIAPGDLAYVIYTSGSTGRPKGIEVTHAALCNFLSSMAGQPGLCSDDVLLAVTTISFDIAAIELLLPLIVGAKVVIADREAASDGRRLARMLNDSCATVMQATPISWEMLLAAGWHPPLDFTCLCGGEALSCRLAEQLLETGAALWNLYGPTETTIWSTLQRVTAESVAASGETVAIGRPIANTSIYLLDDRRQPVPVGVPGEIYIGGKGLARGYHGRPELTAEKFCDMQLFDQPKTRVFRTGDCARWQPDGSLLYLGRLDGQIKIRGFRIELGEIEAALRRHAAVVQAAVAVDEFDGAPGLAAYVVFEDGALEQGDLRRFLSKSLPGYMIPTAWRRLANLTLTANGKVDRRSLAQAPTLDWPQPAADERPPVSEVELLVAELWKELLGVDQISVDDNFFDLGANSQLVMLAHARLLERCPVEHSVTDFYKYPTIEALSKSLSERAGTNSLRRISESVERVAPDLEVRHTDRESGVERGEKRRQRMLRKLQEKDVQGV